MKNEDSTSPTSSTDLLHLTTVSPFTIVFSKGNLDSVAHIMNAVILITVSYFHYKCSNNQMYNYVAEINNLTNLFFNCHMHIRINR